jgi:hypothetical protein
MMSRMKHKKEEGMEWVLLLLQVQVKVKMSICLTQTFYTSAINGGKVL